MSKKLRTEAVDNLFDAILSLQNREECYTFFEDVCTINELLSLSQRFEEKYGLAFTLLADPERKVIEAYDVWKEKKWRH